MKVVQNSKCSRALRIVQNKLMCDAKQAD